jgi:RNA-directed DNA polymerase
MKGLKISDWKMIDWRKASAELKRLQAKLYEALKNNVNMSEIQRIHNEILTSFGARALAVRRVTSNKGGKTSGIDKVLWTRDEQKYTAIMKLGNQNWSKYKASPVKRVWIPKAGNTSEKRPLGIPTIKDRVAQTIWNFILDVHQEHNANPRSFGFRIGRSAKQAITYAWILTSGAGKRELLKIDIRKAYDRVNHTWLLNNVPMHKSVLREWIKTGIIDNKTIELPEMGVPQGGPISPTIFNIVMNGVENEILKVKQTFPIRFADDIIVFSNERSSLEKVIKIINNFLKPRGLEINEAKTEIKPIEIGVDFLGYNIREYPDQTRVGIKGKPHKKGIILVKPGKKQIKSFKLKIKNILKELKYVSAGRLIVKLNPIIRGWANYFNAGGGWTLAKSKLGHYIFWRLMSWITKKHRGKGLGVRVLTKKYFKDVRRRLTYRNKWTFFGMNHGKEVLLTDIQEILVTRENTLKFDPSPNPYNPADYDVMDKAMKRRIKKEILLSKLKQKLLVKQNGLCPLCGEIIDLNLEEAERDHIIPKAMDGKDTIKNTMLVHKTCHLKKSAQDRKHIAYWAKINKNNKSGNHNE